MSGKRWRRRAEEEEGGVLSWVRSGGRIAKNKNPTQ